jgi:hypothetical protein
MPNTPATLPKINADAAAAAPSEPKRPSVPPTGTGGPLEFGTTRKEYGAPKLSAREKAKRNVLTHTLQMPLTVTPLPPPAASSPSQPSAASPSNPARAADAHRRMTLKGGTQPPNSPLPAGWTSMHRVGSGSTPEPSSARSAPRSTDPMMAARRTEPVRESTRAEPVTAQPVGQSAGQSVGSDAPPFLWQQPPSTSQEGRRFERLRHGEFDRDTLPEGTAIRVPSLSTREWLFIALLACASAATLYSLLIDDVRSVEEETDAATGAAAEHVVTPAPVPEPAERTETKAAPATAAAASSNTTEIISEPSEAEIVVGGAVIGNTPARVVRGAQDADYLLRKQGFEPQLVRVTPHSPKTITITLHAK